MDKEIQIGVPAAGHALCKHNGWDGGGVNYDNVPQCGLKKKAKNFSENSLGLRLSICDLTDKDGVLWVADVSFLVHVGRGNGEHGAVVAESQGSNASWVAVELTQALFVEWIPDIHKAV